MEHNSLKRCELLAEISSHLRFLQMPLPENLGEGRTIESLESELSTLRCLAVVESPANTTLSKLLISDGIELPVPDSLADNELETKLWEVIHGMAKRRHFLENTDHLTDRELYQKLWDKTLNEEVEEVPTDLTQFVAVFQMCEDMEFGGEIYMQYYADDFEREMWTYDHPGEPLPPKRELVADRARQMPTH